VDRKGLTPKEWGKWKGKQGGGRNSKKRAECQGKATGGGETRPIYEE